MDCEQALALISSRLDREITPSENAWLSEHLHSCGACRATAEAFALQHAELKTTFKPRRAAAAATANRVNATVGALCGTTPRRRRPVPRPLWIGATVAAGWLVVAVVLFTLLGLSLHNARTVITSGPAQGGMMPSPPPTPTVLSDRLLPRELPKAVRPTAPRQGETVTTAAGERRRAALPDGSTVFLNENTSLKIDALSQVTLQTGAAYFDPIKLSKLGPGYSFVVMTPDRIVSSDGTNFAVQKEENGNTRVLAVDGTITTVPLNGWPTQSQPGAASFLLTAGQMLAPQSNVATASPRLSHVLDWTRDLVAASEPPLIPASSYDGGALIAVDSNGQEAKLSLRKYHVDVHLEDGFARTTIDQTYFNHHPWRLEGTFYFPLPPDASLSRLAMYVDGQLNEGGMVERDYGRTVYERIVNNQRDPALLEWVDGSTFKMRVFPLEGRQEKRIILSYTQRVPTLYGRSQYRFPAGHNLQTVRDWSFHALVKNGANFLATSPTHPGMKRSVQLGGGGGLVLDDAAQDCKVDRDVVLELSDPSFVAEDKDAVRFSCAESDGIDYLMMRYRPHLPAQKTRQRRDWIFLYETSADRDPLLARTQVEIIRGMLQNAEREDTFRILAVSNRIHTFPDPAFGVPAFGIPGGPAMGGGPGGPPDFPIAVAPDTVAEAIKYLEQTHLVGALDLGLAFRTAQKSVEGSNNPYLVHIGSGMTDMGTPQDELPKLLPKFTRYIGIGVGKRWNRAFMKQCAEKTGGYYTQINPDESISWRTFDLMATLNTPRLLNVKVDSRQREDATDKGPLFLLDNNAIAQGEEICAVTRLAVRDGTDGLRKLTTPDDLTITGLLDGEKFEATVRVEKVATEAAYIPRTWAKLEIDRLLAEDARKHKNAIIALSRSMYVMTPFTSLLVLENEAMYKEFKVDRGRKDHWAMYACPEKIPVVYDPDPTMPTDVRNTPKGMKPTANQVMQTVCVRGSPRWLESTEERRHEARHRMPVLFVDTDGELLSAAPLGRGRSVPVQIARYLLFSERSENERGFDLTPKPGQPSLALELGSTLNRPAVEWERFGMLDQPALLTPAPINDPVVVGSLLAGGDVAIPSGSPASDFGLPTGENAGLTVPAMLNSNAISDWYGYQAVELFAAVTQTPAPAISNTFGDQAISRLPKRLRAQETDALIYHRLRYSGDSRVFTDLLTYAPGLNTSEADIRAVLDAEAMPDLRQAPGSIDEDARKLIDASRTGGWEKLTLPAEKNQPEQVIFFDAAGRYTYERKPALGLHEIVVCDGTTLLHEYPEIGLAGRRTVTRFHRAKMAELLPWLLPPAEDLARGVDLKCVNKNTVALVPHWLREVRKPKEETLKYAQMNLIFENKRLAERRLVEMPAKKTLARELYDGDGGVRLLDEKGKEVSKIKRKLSDADAPNLRPDLSGLVVLPLPYRSRTHVMDELHLDSSRPLSAGENGCFAYLEEDNYLKLLAALVAERNAADAQVLYRQCFQEYGDKRRGLFTLLAATGVDVSREPGLQQRFAESPDDELLQYLALCGNGWYKYAQQRLPLHHGTTAEKGGSFLRELSDAQALLLRWDSPRGRTIAWESRQGDVKRSVAFLARHRRDVLGTALLYEMQDRTAGQRKTGEQQRNLTLAQEWQRLADANEEAYRPRYEQACCLNQANKRADAEKVFKTLYARTLEAGTLPPIDGRFKSALQNLDEKQFVDEWNPLMRKTARQFIKDKDKHYGAVVALASQCRRLDETALADTLLADLLGAVKDQPDDWATKLLVVQFYANANELAQADSLLQELLPVENLPPVAAIGGAGPWDPGMMPGAGPMGFPGGPPAAGGAAPGRPGMLPPGGAAAPGMPLPPGGAPGQPVNEKLAQSPALWRLASQLAERRGMEAKAIACLEKALDLEYQHLPEVITLASWRNDYGKLLDHYLKVAQSAKTLNAPPPPDLLARTVRAIDRWRAHDPEANEACKKAADIFALLGEKELAWDYHTTRMIGHGLEVSRWQSIAAEMSRQADYQLADLALTVAADVDPSDAEVVWQRAKNLRQANKDDEADQLMRRLANEKWPERYQGIRSHAQNYFKNR